METKITYICIEASLNVSATVLVCAYVSNTFVIAEVRRKLQYNKYFTLHFLRTSSLLELDRYMGLYLGSRVANANSSFFTKKNYSYSTVVAQVSVQLLSSLQQ